MTDETKQLFDAPWTIKYQVHEGWGTGFEIGATNGMGVAVSPTEENANRLARLPELYDALAEATRDYCSDCVEREIRHKNIPSDYDVVISGCPSCKDGDKCPPLPWLELLRKVRDGE